MRRRLTATFGLGAALACAESETPVLLPEGELPNTLLLVSFAGTELEVLHLEPGVPAHVEASDLDGLLLLGYECAEPERLGFAFAGHRLLEAPTGPVRAPERIYRFSAETDGVLRWVERPVLPDSLSGVPFEFRYPSSCRSWLRQNSPLTRDELRGAKVMVDTPNGAVLIFSRGVQNAPSRLHELSGPDQVREIPWPGEISIGAADIDELGRLWLFSRGGRLYHGPLEGLDRFESDFEAAPSVTPPRACGAGSGENRVAMSVRVSTGTVADVLIVDNSGRLLRFYDEGWTVLSDVAAEPGGESYVCRIRYPDVTWLEGNEALALNRALGSFPVARLGFDGMEMTVSDDGFLGSDLGSGELLNLEAAGVYATLASGGALARRLDGTWSVVSAPAGLTDVATVLISGPDQSIILGSDKDGLRQYWPSNEICRAGEEILTAQEMIRLGEQWLFAVGAMGDSSLWRLQVPDVCAPFER